MKGKNMKHLLMAALMTLFLSGCASIVRDKHQVVPIQTNVENVNIEVSNSEGSVVYSGIAPTSILLKTAKDDGYFNPEKYFIKATKPGYVTQYETIDWHVSNWYIFGNLVFGGLIGWGIVDPLTGRMYYLDEKETINMPANLSGNYI